MARGTSLGELVTMVREEAGHSTNAALGQNTLDGLKQKIRRQQEVLWEDWEWPHLRVQRGIPLSAGSRYYNPPADLSMNHRIDEVSVFFEGMWRPVENGITMAHYNSVHSDSGERRDPVECWELYEGDQIEVWPIPETGDGVTFVTGGDHGGYGIPPGQVNVVSGSPVLVFRGTRNLKPLIAETDTADLDDRLITLFVAAELLAKQKSEDARAKLSMAQRLYEKLKGNNSKMRTFKMGNRNDCRDYRPRPTYGRKL